MVEAMDDTATHPFELDERSGEILRRIVESYLETGEPIGSRNLSKSLAISLSPASVRNVMADLEQLGLIYAPHTSAGRLPTDQGLRFFVDALLNVGTLSDDERLGIEKQVGQGADASIDALLTEASQLLSGLSQGAGLVIANKQDMRLKHIEFVALEPGKALVVLVGEDGSVENRLVDLPAGLPPSALVEASNYLNGHIRGKTLSEAREIIERASRETQQQVDELTRRLVDTGIATWAGAHDADGGSLIVHGRANLLQDVAARDDLDRIRQLFHDLESKKEIVRLIDLAEEGDGVRIFIGSENKLFSLSGSALVVAPWRDRQNRVVGALGIIGPTRLNYARVIPMVDYTAKLVGRLIK
jgi:heat-inducible transcriptional repressor